MTNGESDSEEQGRGASKKLVFDVTMVMMEKKIQLQSCEAIIFEIFSTVLGINSQKISPEESRAFIVQCLE